MSTVLEMLRSACCGASVAVAVLLPVLGSNWSEWVTMAVFVWAPGPRTVARISSVCKTVVLTVGYANRIRHTPPEGVTVATPDPTTIVVTGADKQKVGQFAAEVRASRKPEPYKGKGVRYENETVRRKEGKSFAAGK